MKTNNTDIYGKILKDYPDLINDNDFSKNLEFETFIKANTHNMEAFVGDNGLLFHGSFRGINYIIRHHKDRESFSPNEFIDFVPYYVFSFDSTKLSETIFFRVGSQARCVRVNGNGFFIEDFDFNHHIMVNYYDWMGLQKIDGRDFHVPRMACDILYHFNKDIGDITPKKIEDHYGVMPDFRLSMLMSKQTLCDKRRYIYDVTLVEDGKTIIDDSYDSTNKILYLEFLQLMRSNQKYDYSDYP